MTFRKKRPHLNKIIFLILNFIKNSGYSGYSGYIPRHIWVYGVTTLVVTGGYSGYTLHFVGV